MKKNLKYLLPLATLLLLLSACQEPEMEVFSSHPSVPSTTVLPKPSPTIAPTPEPTPSLTPEPEPSFGPEERETVLQQFLAAVEALFPEPQPFSIVPDERESRSYGSFAVSDVDDAVYLASREGPNYSESLWAWEDGMGNCLYSPGEWMSRNINVVGDQVFLTESMPDGSNGLCSIPCDGGELQLVFENLINVTFVGRTVFAINDGVLLTFPLDRPEERTVIWAVPPEVIYYEYIPFEDGVILKLQAPTPEEYVDVRCLYYCGADGTRKLLDYNIEHYWYEYDNLQVSDGNVYFSHDPGTDGDAQIYQIDLDTGEKTLCCVIPLLYCFQVYDGKLYLSSWSTSRKFSRAESDGSRLEDLVLYEMGGEQNVLDVVTPMEMAVTKEYLYLYGYSYAASGQWITRIPLRGNDRQEKVFFYGEWLTPTEFIQAYYAIPFHPQDA